MSHAGVRRDERKGLLNLVDDAIRSVEIIFRDPIPEFEQIEARRWATSYALIALYGARHSACAAR